MRFFKRLTMAMAALLSAAAMGGAASADDSTINALIDEMQAQADACRAAFEETRDKTLVNCIRACGSRAKNLKVMRDRVSGYTPEELKNQQDYCHNAAKNFGVPVENAGAPVDVGAQTVEQRLASLPEKAAYCKARYEAMNCATLMKGPRSEEENIACHTFNACSCDAEQVAYQVANPHTLPRPNLAMGNLKKCESNYYQAKELEG